MQSMDEFVLPPLTHEVAEWFTSRTRAPQAEQDRRAQREDGCQEGEDQVAPAQIPEADDDGAPWSAVSDSGEQQLSVNARRAG
jgi:hypothetical protein